MALMWSCNFRHLKTAATVLEFSSDANVSFIHLLRNWKSVLFLKYFSYFVFVQAKHY